MANDRMYKWKFLTSKFSEVNVTPNYLPGYEIPNFLTEIDLLTKIYGKPSDVKVVPYRNAYGAQWERSEVYWMMPGGSEIMAFESIAFDQQGKLLGVDFLSKEALAQKTHQTMPNPYGH